MSRKHLAICLLTLGLAFVSSGDQYFRLKIIENAGGTHTQISRFALYDANNNIVSDGLLQAASGSDATALEPGWFCSTRDYQVSNNESVSNIFVNSNSKWCIQNNASIDEGTYTLLLHLPSAAPTVVAYNFRSGNDDSNGQSDITKARSLSTWVLDESFDGTTWKTVSSVKGFPLVTVNNAFYNNGEPFDILPLVWYTNGVIACSMEDFTREEGEGFVYTFSKKCFVSAVTNLHLTAVSKGVAGEEDYGYFNPGDMKKLSVSSSGLLGLTAEIVNPADIPSAAVTPSGEYTESRTGVYTTYTFTGSGSVAVDTPGVVDVEIVGPSGGETISRSRMILNEAAEVVVDGEKSALGELAAAAGTGSGAGRVSIRVWTDYALHVESEDVSRASLQWGVMTVNGMSNIRLQYGTSKYSMLNVVMLAAGVTSGADGMADVAGLDPSTTYYAQLFVDSGSGYEPVGEVVSFTTDPLLPAKVGGKTISVELPVPGLRAGFANVNEIGIATTDTRINWLPDTYLGLFPATNYSADATSEVFPPIWANNRTWVFTGYMYFDGTSYYQFGEYIDDNTQMKIDGATKLDAATWNSFETCCVKPTEGWHSVEFRFSNGTGGAGVSGNTKNDYSTDTNNLQCAFGYGKSATNTQPSKMRTLAWLCDPGDASLLRPNLTDQRVVEVFSVEGFVIKDSQYDVAVSNMTSMTVSGVLYYGDSADINVLTNTSSQLCLYELFELGPYETDTLHLPWESATGDPPYFMVDFDNIGPTPVQSFTASPRVAASVKSVGSDSAVITVAVGFDTDVSGDTPTSALSACFGSTDVGTSDTSLWDSVQSLGSVAAGTHVFTVEGLEVGRSYVLRIMAEDEGGFRVWSDAVSFSVSGVYLGGGLSVYENDPSQHTIELHRAGGSLPAMTVFLEYSGSGIGSVSALPGSVTFESGASTAYVPFTSVDNTRKDGDRSFDISIMEGSAYVAIAPSSVTVSIIDDESAEGEVVTWTGAKDLNWADDANWDKNHVPRSIDTARFAAAGVTSGMEVNLAAAAGVKTLLVETPLPFSIAGTGSLAVSRVERTDVDGVEEGVVAIGVPVVVGNAGNNYSHWLVAGSGGFELNAGLSAPAGIKFLKEGAGSLWLNAADTAYAGPWSIYGGTVYAGAENAIGGEVMIGGDSISARLEALVDNAISPSATPSVYANGVFVAKETADETLASTRVNVYEGGVAELGEHFSGYQAYLTGGTIRGEMFSYGQANQRIVSSASSETALFDCDYRIGAAANDMRITVEDGPAPVDLVLGGRIYYGADAASDQYLTKFGTGTVRTLADWTGMSLGVEIAAGRVLVDNPSSDGLGNQAIRVDGGAILGGTGFIGGTKASYDTSAAVTVDGIGGNEGEIAPGTIDENGNHVIGTLTVGSATSNGSVDFGEYTRLTVHIGADGATDLLQVNGPVSIAEGSGTKLVIVCDDPLSVRDEGHVVLRATGGLTGTFHGVSLPRSGWRVVYTANEIAVLPPLPGRKVIIR